MQGATPGTPAYFDMVKPTYLENWPVALRALSVGQVDVPLTVEEAGDLGSNVSEWSGCFGEPPLRDISGIVARLEDAVRQFPKGAFVRLGSRSPKDSWLGYREGFRCRNAQKAIALLTDASERMAEDLQLAVAQDYPPHIFLREWIDIPVWAEFRCFVKNSQLVGISQYEYLRGMYYPEVDANHESVCGTIQRFFQQRFRGACHLSDVVFDIFVSPTMPGPLWRVALLEINPFLSLTDPCLFSLAGGRGFGWDLSLDRTGRHGPVRAARGHSVRGVAEVKKMGPIAVLFALFVASFVAGIGWYAGRCVVQYVAGIVGRDRAGFAARQVELPGHSEKKSLAVFE